MTTKEKFDAAVNVIKNLPKDGNTFFIPYSDQSLESWRMTKRFFVCFEINNYEKSSKQMFRRFFDLP